MSALTLGIRYLTGYAVATDPSNRETAEWPPHPGRIFMALAAAHFETGEDPSERAALEWLESLPAPSLHAPKGDPRTVVTHFVPVNDTAGPSKAPLQSAPDFTRDRAGRTFPRVRLHDEEVFLVWTTEALELHRTALAALCSKVIRVGHSSSLVQMWLADQVTANLDRYDPDPLVGDPSLRTAGPGTLGYLRREFNGDAIETFARLSDAIQSTRGREQKALKDEFEAAFGIPWKKSLLPPESRRPSLGLWQGYREARPETEVAPVPTVFDPAIQVLRLVRDDSPFPGLELTTSLKVVDTLRRALQAKADKDLGIGLLPEVLSGHQPDGTPSERPHAAFLPLAFVDHQQADGHLLGLGLALPRKEYWPERDAEYRTVITLLARIEKLTLGALGVWRVVPELGETPPVTLRPTTWTGGRRGATTWATVTPIVFDFHPKEKDRVAYLEAVTGMVRTACTRIGLPEPVDVDLSAVSWHRGAPLARDFPRLTRKDGSERRHMHAWLRFDRPVVGPVLLGAGRYRGYGLCRPVFPKRETGR